MAILLKKSGEGISLKKEVANLRKLHIGLGWDECTVNGRVVDLDASVFLLNKKDRVMEQDFVFYQNLTGAGGAVVHMGDDQTGGGGGDDEEIKIDLLRLEEQAGYVEKIVIFCTIYDAEAWDHNFGQVTNAFIRLVNDEDGVEIVRFSLTEKYSKETAIMFGEVYRKNRSWHFRAGGKGYQGGLRRACEYYGLQVQDD